MTRKRARVRSEERERFWRALVEGQQRSGVSVRQWCHRHRVSEPSFYFWRRELALRSRYQSAPLVPVEVSPSPASRFDLEIELPVRVLVRVGRGCEVELLRQTLALLFGGQEAESC